MTKCNEEVLNEACFDQNKNSIGKEGGGDREILMVGSRRELQGGDVIKMFLVEIIDQKVIFL